MLKNIGSNWALNVVQILVFMVLSPFVVGALGKDVNGVWQSIVALAGPLQLMILGVPMASVRFITENLTKEDREGTDAAVSTCLAICVTMGTAALLVGTGLYFFFESKYLASESWAGLTPQTLSDARVAFAVFVLTVTLGFAGRLPIGIFEAHHDFIRRNLVVGGGFLLKLTLTLILLSQDASLIRLAIVQISCMLAEFGVALWIIRRRYPEISFGLKAFDRKMVRRILSFSIFAMLLNVGAQLAFRTDALVIGWFKSPGDVTTYDIGNKIFEPFTNLILGIGMVVMPMATALHAKGETADLGAVFSKWTKISFTLVLVIGLYLLLLGPEFLAWWFGDEYDPASGTLLQVLMASFLIFLPVRGVALPILMGLGQPGRPAVGLLGMGLLNLGLSIALIGRYGLMGVALGTAIPNVLFAAFVFATACRQLDLRPTSVIWYTFGRAIPGAVPPIFLLLLIKWNFEVAGFLGLTLAGVAFVALFVLGQIFFVFKGDPHLDLHQLVMAKLKPAAADKT